jgi:hypothetical protein
MIEVTLWDRIVRYIFTLKTGNAFWKIVDLTVSFTSVDNGQKYAPCI